MTEPPNTEALLATVRESFGPGQIHRDRGNAALKTLIAQRNRYRHAHAELEAELERVRAERDEVKAEVGWLHTELDKAQEQRQFAVDRADVEMDRRRRVQARLDRAVEALREIAQTVTYDDTQGKIARAALAEIEESG